MRFNLVNDQEQVAQFVWQGMAWRGVAWRGVVLCCMVLALGFIAGGVACSVSSVGVY